LLLIKTPFMKKYILYTSAFLLTTSLAIAQDPPHTTHDATKKDKRKEKAAPATETKMEAKKETKYDKASDKKDSKATKTMEKKK
jgi:hypothetical protein